MIFTLSMCAATALVVATVAWWLLVRKTDVRSAKLASRLKSIEVSLGNARAGIFILYPEGGYVESSSAAAQLIGLQANITRVTTDEWWLTVHAEQRDGVRQIIGKAIATGEPCILDYRIAANDAKPCWLRLHGLPIKNAQGHVHEIYGTLIEMTASKLFEQEVQAREERLQEAAAVAKFKTWEFDLDLNLYTLDIPTPRKLDVQGGCQDRWMSGSNIQTSTLEQVLAGMHPDDVPIFKRTLERVRSEDVPYETETRVKDPHTGEWRWNVWRGRAARDVNGRKHKIRGIVQDIHDSKAAEIRLRETEARLERATRGTNDGLWEFDVRKQSGWVSPRFAEMLGYSHEEFAVSQKYMFGTSHPDDHKIFTEVLRRHFKDGDPVDMELRKQTKGGEWRWFRVRGGCERDSDGNPLTVSGSQQDVTERRQYQQALIEATATAAAANKAKSEFLANMSHEIRTPMNGVIGMTELLIETPMTPMQRDYAETVRDSAAALLTVINDILDFSKVEAGKLDLEMLDMDMRDTIEDVARLLAIQAHAKGLEVTALLDPNLPDLIRGDAGRVRQILLNLGGNAVKFTSQGEVAIDCRVLEKDERGTLIRCEIRDTGIGIPPERLGALFQPFTQVDASTTRRFGGTGLGLSIVKRIVELMGGETGVSSQVGVGSVFWFAMRFGVAQHANATPVATPAALRGQRILVVDDNATNRKVIMGQLMLCHMEPICASSADEAIVLMRQAQAANKPFEVALLDHQMPDCDGAKLGKLIVADTSLRSTRLILLTSSGQRGDGHLFAELGFAGYLLKPVTQRDLVDCLTMVLSSHAEAWHVRSQPIVTRHALRSNRAQRKFRLLLAEDNLVNQKVACRTLEKLGFRVDVAADGQIAVEAWATGRYDLILMDCQMPVIDGYEATRMIRARESDGKHIPIVALTAHAMKGADEECAAAGMDDYLSKPIDRLQLTACLDKWLTQTTQAATLQTATMNVMLNADDPIDWEQLLKATAGDQALAHELAALFIVSGAATLDDIVAALESGDYGRLGNKAHELKGAAANLQALGATTAAQRLEIAAHNGDVDQIPELTETLRREVERAVDYLKLRVA